MARTPTSLAGPLLIDSTAETIYTSSGTTVIKCITVANASGGALTITFSIGADATATRFIDAYSVSANSNVILFLYVVMTDTEILQAKSSGDDVLVATVSGDVYS